MRKIIFLIVAVVVALSSCSVVPATVVSVELDDSVSRVYAPTITLAYTVYYSDGSTSEGTQMFAADNGYIGTFMASKEVDGVRSNYVQLYWNDGRLQGGTWIYGANIIFNSNGTYQNGDGSVIGTWETRVDSGSDGQNELYFSGVGTDGTWYNYEYTASDGIKPDQLWIVEAGVTYKR